MTFANRLINDREQRSQARWNLALYGCVIGALLCVLLMGFWGLYRDLTLNQATILKSVVSRLRTQALRRARHLETGLERVPPGQALSSLRDDPWFQQFWAGVTPLQEQQLYAAVLDLDGTVVFHSDPLLEGRRLSHRWYDRVIDEAGDDETGVDIVESAENMLAAGRPSYDIQIPLFAGNRQVGEYLEGLRKSWVDERVRGNRNLILRRSSIVIGAILAVVLLSLLSLYFIARRSIAWRQAAALAHVQRITEVGQLAAGMAHEIRNPLHAIRLNLHTLRRAYAGDTEFGADEIDKLTYQSQEEIDRIDQLMRELLGYASPEQARDEDIDACEELQATLQFLANEVQRDGVKVAAALPPGPAIVHIDKNRFRQVVLNILLNAKEAMSDGGVIHLSLRQLPKHTEIIVEDEGPGVLHQDAEKIFEPFYTTKDGGTGFGLAIAKRFVTEAGGTITCSSNGHVGAKFRLTLPRRARKEGTGAMS